MSAAIQLYRRHWRTLLAIAAVVVVPFTLLQYLFGDLAPTHGGATSTGMQMSMSTTSGWAVTASLLTAFAGLLM